IHALNSMLQNGDPIIEEITQMVELDPVMSSRFLQLANSTFFGQGKEMTDLKAAIASLGLPAVRDLLAVGGLFIPQDNDAAQIESEIENHSLKVARLATRLVNNPTQASTAFSAGLLHDIGRIVLATTEEALQRSAHEALITASVSSNSNASSAAKRSLDDWH